MTDASTPPPPSQKQLYDDKVDTYAAIKSNPFKVYCEEPTFWSIVNDSLRDKNILDLACGSGHYTRAIRRRGKARHVVGVDVSLTMIGAARRAEASDPVGDIEYVVSDAARWKQGLQDHRRKTQTAGDEMPYFQADVVTAQYLIPYASTLDELREMFDAAYDALRYSVDGRFISITGMSRTGEDDPRITMESEALGYRMTWHGQPEDDDKAGVEIPDGTCVEMTIFGTQERGGGTLEALYGTLGGQGKDEVQRPSLTFPNYIWSRRTIERTLCEAGFHEVKWHPFVVSEEGREWAEGEAAKDLRGGWLDNIGFFVASK